MSHAYVSSKMTRNVHQDSNGIKAINTADMEHVPIKEHPVLRNRILD